jgi:hypothetical protein
LLASVREPAQGLTATAVGLVLLVVGTTTVFAELQNALDRIWRVPGRMRKSGWLTLVRARLMAFGLILAVGCLLIESLLTSAVLAALGRHLDPVFGGWQAMVEPVNAVGSLLLVAFMFGLIYMVMPRQRVLAVDVWLGALLAALPFTGARSPSAPTSVAVASRRGLAPRVRWGRGAALDVLFSADPAGGRRIHLRLRLDLRLQKGRRGGDGRVGWVGSPLHANLPTGARWVCAI